MLTLHQCYLIEECKKIGFGYALFAASVEKQGFCSGKQEAALSNMQAAGEYRKNNLAGNHEPRYRDIYFIDREEGGEW
jgi:hypothetical protein